MQLFIDTNIYLAFYHLTNDDLEELRKLSLLVRQKRLTLYVTDQIVSEYRRNRDVKINEALRKLKEQKLNLQFPQICKDYDEYKSLRDLQKSYEEAHNSLYKKLITDVSQLRLKADEIIQELFDSTTVIESNTGIIENAFRRVQIGNPPGKNGSLGDAINWEVLLKAAPSEEDLYILTDDQDYVSVLDDTKLKDFLLLEWREKKNAQAHCYKRLSSFLKDHYPDIDLSSEFEKEVLIKKFVSSGSFTATHAAVAGLARYTDYSASQTNDIIDAALTNNQILWILGDEDVSDFLNSIVSDHSDRLDQQNLSKLLEFIGKEEESSDPVDEIPF